MAAVKKKYSTNKVFLGGFSGQKNSKNKNFDIILVPFIAIHVTNMWLKFREDRSSSLGGNYNAARKNVGLRKTRLEIFSMKNPKRIQNTFCFDFLKSIFLSWWSGMIP